MLFLNAYGLEGGPISSLSGMYSSRKKRSPERSQPTMAALPGCPGLKWKLHPSRSQVSSEIGPQAKGAFPAFSI